MHNERLHGELTFSISVSLDDVNASEEDIKADIQRTLARSVAANERFLPKGVTLDELWLDFEHIYTKDEDDRIMDYKMNTNPNV